jgi:hypothetical protein
VRPDVGPAPADVVAKPRRGMDHITVRSSAVVAGASAWLHPFMTSAGGMSGALLDPFRVGRRGDQLDQSSH